MNCIYFYQSFVPYSSLSFLRSVFFIRHGGLSQCRCVCVVIHCQRIGLSHSDMTNSIHTFSPHHSSDALKYDSTCMQPEVLVLFVSHINSIFFPLFYRYGLRICLCSLLLSSLTSIFSDVFVDFCFYFRLSLWRLNTFFNALNARSI